jgi:methyl-accepting chemotaxis protein
MKIGAQIITVSFLLVLISVTCTSIIATRNFSDYMQRNAEEDMQYSKAGFDKMVHDNMERTRSFRDNLLKSAEIARLVGEKDTEALYILTKQLMDAANIDILVVAAADGEVLACPHNREMLGDNIGGDADVRNALRGNSYEMFMPAASTKLGYYCGAPIKYNGETVGMLRVAMSLENTALVDQVKELFGVEVTIFADKTRINTTLHENGRRMVGTDAAQAVAEQVLQKGEDYYGNLNLAGIQYLTHYTPLKDPDSGRIIGMLFAGKSMESVNAAIMSSITSVGVSSLVILAMAFVISYWLAGKISKPLGRFAKLSERGKDGDLTITEDDFGWNGRGELGMLVKSLSGMIASQRTVISRVISSSASVTDHTTDLAALARENNDAMINTRSLIDEVSLLCDANAEAIERSGMTISEMAQGAASVANMSVSGAESLSKTTQISKNAVDSVNNLVMYIDAVDNKTMENQSKIQELSGSVSEISDFMNVIASIADQTNLLALNAAIEAARAGDDGRGFVVVADEVRKLAEESRNASKSVEVLVSTLIRNAKDAISATEDSVEIVHQIMSMANTTADDLNAAMKEITNINESIQSIAAVAQQQAAASSEITNAIDAVNKSTGQISRKMSELHDLSNQTTSIGNSVSTSAEEMSQSTEEMKELLSHFKMSAAEPKIALKAAV